LSFDDDDDDDDDGGGGGGRVANDYSPTTLEVLVCVPSFGDIRRTVSSTERLVMWHCRNYYVSGWE